MNRRTSCALLLASALLVRAGLLDRVAVAVGKHVISERDLIADIRISAFLDGKTVDPSGLSGAQKRQAADRLVDQYLVLQDAALTRAALATPAEAASLLDPIKARYPSEAAYRAALEKAGITEAELAAHMLRGLRMLRYTDIRFRPEAQVSEEAIRAYYDQLSAREKGGPPGALRTFAASHDQIEKLLTDQQVMQSLDQWLKMTRNDTRIVYQPGVFQDAAPAAGAAGGRVSP